MASWEMLDGYDKTKPCVECGEDSFPTVHGNHFKCKECDHLWNEDGAKVKVQCFCKKCTPIPEGPKSMEGDKF